MGSILIPFSFGFFPVSAEKPRSAQQIIRASALPGPQPNPIKHQTHQTDSDRPTGWKKTCGRCFGVVHLFLFGTVSSLSSHTNIITYGTGRGSEKKWGGAATRARSFMSPYVTLQQTSKTLVSAFFLNTDVKGRLNGEEESRKCSRWLEAQ